MKNRHGLTSLLLVSVSASFLFVDVSWFASKSAAANNGVKPSLLVEVKTDTEAKRKNQAAKDFIQSMADSVILFISDRTMTRSQRKERLKDVLDRNFDTYTIGRFTLGRYWKDLTAEQQREYLALYEDMIVSMYADKFASYQGEIFKTGNVLNAGGSDFTVASFITSEAGDPVPVSWHVRLKNGEYKVIDVSIEDVSMIITQKADFSSTIQRKGGSAAVILDYLREKTGQGT